VRQNLLIGVKPGQRGDDSWTIDKIYSYFPQLEKRDGQKGGHLSGGEQQMLTIGRTLMGNPEVLLVDEPTEGLAPVLVKMVLEILKGIHQKGGSILIVEQAMDEALSLAGRAYVMAKGEIVFKGTGEELYRAEDIRKRYLEV
jgi:branched-chain amino acid transport system ATP-binding protein